MYICNWFSDYPEGYERLLISPVHTPTLIDMLDEEINYMLIRGLDGMNQ